jgi:polyhydroxybutyrate depolymerase
MDLGKTISDELPAGGRLREYLIHFSRKESRWPAVVIALHGAGSDAAAMEQFCGLSELADERGFCVVYPQGSGRTANLRSWNAGGNSQFAAREKIDDVQFLLDLLHGLQRKHRLHTERIFLVGMSNGAAMAYRAGVEIPERVAGIAAVAGCLSSDVPNPSHPVPVVHFHGTEDTFVPYGGGMGRSLTRTPMHSVAETMALWVDANQAAKVPESTEFPPSVADGTWVCRDWYHAMETAADVQLWTIHGGGHTWPGRMCPYPFLGKSTVNVNANEEIWKFFQQCPEQP